MTFYFDAKSLRELLDENPDYILVNAGTTLITDPSNIKKQLAVMITNAEAYKNGSSNVMRAAAGCPVPPCRPGGGTKAENEACNQTISSLLESYKSMGNFVESFK